MCNSVNRTLVPIRCRVVKKLSAFDGSWTVSWVCSMMINIYADPPPHRCGKVSSFHLGFIALRAHLYDLFVAGLMDEISLKVNLPSFILIHGFRYSIIAWEDL
jgi:hypothetical protein